MYNRNKSQVIYWQV